MTQFALNHPTVYRYLVSSLTTFLTALFGSLAIQIGSGVGIQLTGAFLLSIISVAVRAGFKATVESVTTTHGDPQVTPPSQS